MKKIIIMNGRWINGKDHAYIGAYSISDACRMCSQITHMTENQWRREIDIYFSKGAWGNHMKDIPIERGIWVQKTNGKPEKIL